MAEWQKELLKYFPSEINLTWRKLWEYPDEYLKLLSEDKRKYLVIELLNLANQNNILPNIAVKILLFCYMSLRGNLNASVEEFEIIVNKLHELFANSNYNVRSIARGTLSLILMSGNLKKTETIIRRQILEYLTEDIKENIEDYNNFQIVKEIMDGLLAIAFTINSLTADEMDFITNKKLSLITVASKNDKAEIREKLSFILHNSPIRDMIYLFLTRK